jgi:hypothetical protein
MLFDDDDYTKAEKLRAFVRIFTKAPVNALHYIQNRFVSRSHLLDTRLKPGCWHETETQMLHGCFEALVDYVEIQEAWLHAICNDELAKTLPWYVRSDIFNNFFHWRNAGYGVAKIKLSANMRYGDEDHPAEQCQADQLGLPTKHALSAQEILDLYDWWKNVRPNRLDCYADGVTDQMIIDQLATLPPPIQAYSRMPKSSARRLSIEECYELEDDQNFIRLVKIRTHLWT